MRNDSPMATLRAAQNKIKLFENDTVQKLHENFSNNATLLTQLFSLILYIFRKTIM